MEQLYNSQLQNQQYADQQAGTDGGLFSDLGQRLNPSSSSTSSSQYASGIDNQRSKSQWLKHEGKAHSNETVDHFQKLQAASPPASAVPTAAAHGNEEKKDKK
ncbi:hypothetical protein HDU87_002481 [Geranomyces variabilis]|uniref:Uncharacterized protein n=1 Tax=Geranomyces variabilis TaxID=109894 RepID=A0AAD5TRB4_9FUNG|nr:hypothetical protein HDU87_002481 [Geranomyces variabilis]